jgi:hypothetical protein
MKTRSFCRYISHLALCATPSLWGADTAVYDNQRFSVVRTGLAVSVCDKFDSNPLSVKMPTLPIRIENGLAMYSVYDPSDSGAVFFGRCDGVVAEPLIVGEIVVAESSKITAREFRLRIVSAPHAIRRGIGAFQHVTSEAGAAELRFKLADPKDSNAVHQAITQWLRPEAALAKLPTLDSRAAVVFLGTDRKCAVQFREAVDSMDGLEKRKRMADLVSYGCGFITGGPVHVKVGGFDANYVLVELAEGTQQGKRGWVPIEWIR